MNEWTIDTNEGRLVSCVVLGSSIEASLGCRDEGVTRIGTVSLKDGADARNNCFDKCGSHLMQSRRIEGKGKATVSEQ